MSTEAKPLMKFKLLRGSLAHTVTNKDGTKTILHFEPGQVYETTIDMVRKEGRERWERVNEDAMTIEDLKARLRILEGQKMADQGEAYQGDDLDAKSIPQLRAIAEKLDPPIDLSKVKSKSDIVALIREAQDVA